MSVYNRSTSPSQGRQFLQVAINGALTNGETGIIGFVPCPSVLEAANIAAFNPTSAANMLFLVSRFVVGQGFTSWAIGSTFVPPAFGVSGNIPSGNVQFGGVSLPASGSTLLQLMANDVIQYQIGGGVSAAIFGLAGAFIIRPLQDIRVFINTTGPKEVVP